MSELDAAKEKLRAASLRALREIAEDVGEAAARMVPIGNPAEDPHPNIALRESWSVDVRPSVFGGNARITFDTAYARKQELNQRLNHPRGGSHSYLNNAVKQAIPTLEQELARRVRGAV